MAILVSLESLQNGYELHEKVLIRMGWDMATAQAEKKFNSLQQLKAEIRAMCIELECTSHDKFDCGMYHALRGRLRELSAV